MKDFIKDETRLELALTRLDIHTLLEWFSHYELNVCTCQRDDNLATKLRQALNTLKRGQTMKISLKRLTEEAKVPTHSREGDAGLDLWSDLSNESGKVVLIYPQETVMVRTGISMAIPTGWYGHICDRSGVAKNQGLHVLGGVVDSTYRGEVCVLLCNTGNNPQVVKHQERIAQMIIKQHETVEFVEVNDLDETVRGENGFGSSGKD